MAHAVPTAAILFGVTGSAILILSPQFTGTCPRAVLGAFCLLSFSFLSQAPTCRRWTSPAALWNGLGIILALGIVLAGDRALRAVG